MWETAGALFAAAAVNLRSTWRSFAMTDLAYKAIAFRRAHGLATSWLIYWFRAGTSHRVIARTWTLHVFSSRLRPESSPSSWEHR
jgi:hypothetical protein